MTIYTRRGDKGFTRLIGGQRIFKDHPRINALGAIDELNASLGVLRVYCGSKKINGLLKKIQHDLYLIGAAVADRRDAAKTVKTNILALEKTLDALERKHRPLKKFIVPGGAPFPSYAHLARTIARRAEREVVTLSRTENLNPEIIVYLNRTSDLLFMLAVS